MRPIVVLDSGVGGLPYLSWIRDHLPKEHLLYIADRLFFPYGEKSAEDVRRIVVDLAQKVVKAHHPKLLIVACNTASVHALQALRENLDIPVVGVVPAIKTAASVTRNRRIGILATELTIRSDYLCNLVQEFASHLTVMSFSAGDIVRYVEDAYLYPDHYQRDQLLQGWATRIKKLNLDTVVLGCTHFLHVIPELRQFLGPDITLVDSQSGVGRRAYSLLEEMNDLEQEGQGSARFYVRWHKERPLPQEDLNRYQTFAECYGLAYQGICGEFE